MIDPQKNFVDTLRASMLGGPQSPWLKLFSNFYQNGANASALNAGLPGATPLTGGIAYTDPSGRLVNSSGYVHG